MAAPKNICYGCAKLPSSLDKYNRQCYSKAFFKVIIRFA